MSSSPCDLVSLLALLHSGKKTEYKLWRLDLLEKESEMEKNGSVEHYQCQSMISFPYVLTAATKAAILELDASKCLMSVPLLSFTEVYCVTRCRNASSGQPGV